MLTTEIALNTSLSKTVGAHWSPISAKLLTGYEKSGLIPLAIVWFIFHDRYYYWRIRKSTKKLLREGSNAGMLGKQTLMLIDHCFKAIDANGETEYKGRFIKKLVENSRYIYCYISSIAAIIIPKNAFASEEKLADFKDGIRCFLEPE